ncbi:MAG: T9SS type A sorting domain-containing protein [Flavobacteriales bacterium]|nr:T9SS type A sorting domain-containing protein [Flavobacteriales bacterium]
MRSFLFTVLLSSSAAMAQTGPGGVGSNTNNVLWLRANSGVTQSSGAVSQWDDQSGNANHAYLPGAIPTAKPAFVSNSVNGYPSLDFDGTDDQLWVSDAASLDLTQWHFFIVVTADLQKDYNAWMVKGDDSDENWEMLSYSDGNIHTPTKYTDGTRTFPSSAGGQVTTTTFEVIEYSYSTGVGRDVYKNATNIITDNDNKTPKVNNLPLYIANERSTTGRCINGDIAEVVAYNVPLNSTQRIIVNNYLAAKYDRTLGANDIYVQDNAVNGNYDHDVAGIGRVTGTDLQTDSRGSGIVQISKAAYTGLGDNEFLLWGHNNAEMDAWGVTDYPPTMQGRVARVWRVNEVNGSGTAVDVGNVDITFDLAGLGTVTTSDLRLLVDTDNDGLFADETPISGATNPSGTLYRFSNTAALVNGRRFTIGTMNALATPLPIELLAFDAEPVGPHLVRATWSTATERNNHQFTVERSVDGIFWNLAGVLPGAGNSSEVLNYELFDQEADNEVLYYRLRQTDNDGAFTLSDTRAVHMRYDQLTGPTIFPNPGEGQFTIAWPEEMDSAMAYEVIDAAGKRVQFRASTPSPLRTEIDLRGQAPGLYVVRVLPVDRTPLSRTVVIR